MARTGVIYGPTGVYKTAQGKGFAHYIARKTGKATLLFSADGGGWDALQREVDEGMIVPFRCDMSLAPLPLIRRIGQGYWPVDPKVDNPRDINLKLIDWNEYGGYMIEGWTSISAAAMRYLPDANVNVGGEDRSKLGGWSQGIKVDGEMRTEQFRSNTRGDYGWVQNFLYGFVMQCAAFPCEYVLFTALESKTEDDDKATVYGPAISGKKATSQCGAWVGDMIHASDYTVYDAPKQAGDAPTGKTEVRYYFKRHLDPVTQIAFPAKPRVIPEILTALERRFPGGFFIPRLAPDGVTYVDDFGTYLGVIDALRKDEKLPVNDAMTAWRKKMDERRKGGGQPPPGAAPPAPGGK